MSQTSVYDSTGKLLSSTPFTAEEEAVQTALVNRDELLKKAAAALASNAAFLADASVTQAEAVLQLQRATRQLNVLIKLLVNEVQAQDGT